MAKTLQNFVDYLDSFDDIENLEEYTDYQTDYFDTAAEEEALSVIHNCIDNSREDMQLLELHLELAENDQKKLVELAKTIMRCSDFTIIYDLHTHWNEVFRFGCTTSLDTKEELMCFFDTEDVDDMMQELREKHDVEEYYEIDNIYCNWVAKVDTKKLLEELSTNVPSKPETECRVLDFAKLTEGKVRQPHRFYRSHESRHSYASRKGKLKQA